MSDMKKRVERLIREFDDARWNLKLEYSSLESQCKTCPKIIQDCDGGCNVGKLKDKIRQKLNFISTF